MCEKKPYCGTRIDPCLVEIVQKANTMIKGHTILSCCGHNKYHKTIVIRAPTGEIWELFTLITLSKKPRKNHHYYRKDSEGFYYIPEVEQYYTTLYSELNNINRSEKIGQNR